MTIEESWFQAGTYPARLDRGVISALTSGEDRILFGCLVVPTGPATFSVEVQVGEFVIVGDDQADQGSYWGRITATETVVLSATPGSSRTDMIGLQVNDPQAGGAAGDNITAVAIDGTTIAPPSVVGLALVQREPGELPLAAGVITDIRPLGGALFGVVSANPPGTEVGPPGTVWIQY